MDVAKVACWIRVERLVHFRYCDDVEWVTGGDWVFVCESRRYNEDGVAGGADFVEGGSEFAGRGEDVFAKFSNGDRAAAGSGYDWEFGADLDSAAGVSEFGLTAAKTFPITEKARMQLRAEFYNAINHTQFWFAGGTLKQQNARLSWPILGGRFFTAAVFKTRRCNHWVYWQFPGKIVKKKPGTAKSRANRVLQLSVATEHHALRRWCLVSFRSMFKAIWTPSRIWVGR